MDDKRAPASAAQPTVVSVRSTAYKTSPDTACAAVPGGAVIIHLGTNRYFSLNATAAVVWSRLDAGEDSTAIAAALARDFRVDDVTARDAVSRTIAQFEEAGLLFRA